MSQLPAERVTIQRRTRLPKPIRPPPVKLQFIEMVTILSPTLALTSFEISCRTR